MSKTENRTSFLHLQQNWARLVWGIIALLALISGAHAAPAQVASTKPLPPVTTIQEFYSLPAAEAARGYPIRLQATVLYADPRWHILYLEDSTFSMYTALPSSSPTLRDGDRIEIQAVSALRDAENLLDIKKVVVLTHGELPPPRAMTVPDLFSNHNGCRRTSQTGLVVKAAEDDKHLSLTLLVGQRYLLKACVRDFSGRDVDSWIDCKVVVTGVNVTYQPPDETNAPAAMVISGLDDVVVLERGIADDSQMPVTAISDLKKLWAGTNNHEVVTHRVRLKAAVVPCLPGKSIKLRDDSGEVVATSIEPSQSRTNDVLDIFGYPIFSEQGTPSFIVQRFRLMGMDEVLKKDLPKSALPLIERAADVHRLAPEEAERRYPVQLRAATVTYYDREWRNLFVQDDSGPIYVVTDQLYSFKSGDIISVTGVSDKGGYAPLIRRPVIRFIGSGPIPTPVPAAFDDLITGKYDCSWIEMEGVVRTATNDGTHTFLGVRGKRGSFDVTIAEPPPVELAGRLVDSEVVFRGVCTTKFNPDRQLVGLTLRVPSWSCATFPKLSEENSFERPATKIRDLLRFSADVGKHRVAIEGIITLAQTNTIVVQDATGAIWLKGAFDAKYAPGQHVQAVGFPTPGVCSPALENPSLRVRGHGPIPAALNLDPAVIMLGTNDAQRIRVRGRLVEYLPGRTESQLALQAIQGEDRMFNAIVGSSKPGSFEPGSILEIEGICQVRSDGWNNIQSFRVLLDSGNQVRVIATPAWWTRREAPLILAAFAMVCVLAFAWGIMLRRQVSLQTSVIRRQLEQAVALEHRYRELFENASDVIYTVDMQGQCTRFNKAAEEAFGYSIEEGKTVSHSQLYVPDSFAIIDRALETVVKSGIFPVIQVESRASTGQNRILELKARAIYEHSKLSGFQCTARDITERQQLEKKFLQAQKMEAVGQLAGGIAHDFNNLLTVIIGNASLLNDDSTSPSDSRELSNQISQAADRAAKLTSQLLTFSRKQVLQVKRINLNDTISGITRLLGRVLGEHITLNLDCSHEVPPIDADSGMIEQVIMNLSVNARDAMPKGGQLTIRTRLQAITAEQAARTAEAREGEFVALSVTDTGSGIKREMMAKLFEPFFTTKDVGKGTGLGLATVYGIVKKHDGWIEVASELGHGSTFTVYLPIATNGDPEA